MLPVGYGVRVSAWTVQGTSKGFRVNFWGWLIVFGSVGAAVGFTLYGMGTSTLQPDGLLVDTGKYLLFGGLIVLAIGFFAFKATDRSERT